MVKILCIYHGNCDDGFAAAWAVRHALGTYADIEFYAGVYQQPPPDVTGRHVILVDFSYKRPVLQRMVDEAASVLILDHHKTAAEDLAGLPFAGASLVEWRAKQGAKLGVLFDMDRSGAGIAWDFFHNGALRPDFIHYIEDRDLWRKKLPGGDEFTIALRSYPQDFDVWDKLVDSRPSALIAEGFSIQRYYRARVEEIKRTAYRATIDWKPPGAGHLEKYRSIIMIANAPYFAASEVAGELCQIEGIDFGACYFEVSRGRWQYSLRSRAADDFDVSAVALAFGGGGHKGAAGFTVDAPVHI